MSIAFDQYQRYKNTQIVVDQLREDGQQYRILEVGANEHKNLEKFLPQDEIYYLDIQLSENLLNDPRYFLGDATAMDFGDNEFDIIVALDVYEHISPEKRESFLSEVNRVSKRFFIICAPFYSSEVVNAEIRANLLYKSIYGTDYVWLKEHQENGLPDFDEIKEFLLKQNIDFSCFSHGDITIWEQLMNTHFLSVKDTSLVCYCDAIDEYYNQHIFEEDYVENAYRKFVVGIKPQNEKRISLPEKVFPSDENIKKMDFLLENFNILFDNKNNDCLRARVNEMKKYEVHNQLQIFYDYGEGFSEENSFTIEYGDFTFSLSLTIPETVQQIRIDPVEGNLCMIGDLIIQNEYGKTEPLLSDGENLGNCYIFTSKDPQIVINRHEKCFKTLLVQGKIWFLDTLEIQTLVGYLQQNDVAKREYEKRLQIQEVICRDKLDEVNTENENVIRELENQKMQYEEIVRSLEHKELQYKEIAQDLENLKQELQYYQIHYQAAINQREELKTQLQQVQMNYDVISNATCWRMTAPLRAFLDSVKVILKRNYYSHLFCKGLKCLKQNGFRYTWFKLKNWNQYRQNFLTANEPLYTPEELAAQKTVEFSKNIKFSILVPLYNTPEKFLHEMIQSVLDQTYANWELCLADGSDDEHRDVEKICRSYVKKDKRIQYQKLEKNLGISGNTNACIEMATGEYIALLDHDDLLAPNALFENASAIEKTDADILYSDEDHLTIDEKHVNPFYKPDWSPDLLYSQMYICHFLVVKKEILKKTGGFRSEYNGSQDYDLILRLSEQTEKICHIPLILYTWRESENSTAANAEAKPYAHIAGKKALKEHLERKYGSNTYVEDGKYTFTYDARFPMTGEPVVSIIIPMKDKWKMTDNCVQSILQKSTYQNFEIILINNRSEEIETLNWLDKIITVDDRIKVFEANIDFNWSKLNNFGMSKASGDIYIFLNNDTLIISSDWIERLSENAMREDIGVVGAMLLYEDETIQHAGVVVGIGGWADHIFKGMLPIHYGSPFVSPVLSRNVLAVTGACMAISRDTIQKIGNFDESFIICGSDVEICIRAYEYGLFNRYDANVQLYHLESKSRDSYIPEIDFEKSYECYAPYRENIDPFFNINLDNNSIVPKERAVSVDWVNFKNYLKRCPVTAQIYEKTKDMIIGTQNFDIPEIGPIYARKGAHFNSLYRLNLLIPSVDQKHVFGGISTAMKFFEELRKQCKCDARIITLDAPVDLGTSTAPKEYCLIESESDSIEPLQLISFSDRYQKTIPVCENDIFMATGWWTAYVIKSVIEWQRDTYGGNINPLIYFIQDFEPGFYPWSSRYLLADSTYKMNIPIWAIINSKELHEYFNINEYSFEKMWYFEPVLNSNLKKILMNHTKSVKKKKRILVYGRPSVERNAFSIIVIALKEWVTLYSDANEWEICSAGEQHSAIELGNGVKLKSVGKLSLDDYADFLLETYAGISLMVSPHPSYPPLEMATFGIKTITNSYANKDLTAFSDNVISLNTCSPKDIASILCKICESYDGCCQLEVNTDYVQGNNQIGDIIGEIQKVLGEK